MLDDGCLSLPAQVLTFVPWEGRGGESKKSKTLSRKSSKGRKSKGKGEEKKAEEKRRRRRRQRKRGKKGGKEGGVVVHLDADGDHDPDEGGDCDLYEGDNGDCDEEDDDHAEDAVGNFERGENVMRGRGEDNREL